MNTSSSNESWRVVLFTDQAGPLLYRFRDLLEARGHTLAGVFTSPPPRSRLGSQGHLDVARSASELRIPVVISPRRKQWPALLRAFEPDLAICAMFMWKIPEAVYTLPRLGMFNVHIGQLPQYRGTNSVGWAFRRDEGKLGTTAHWMAPDWDTGPVLARGFLPYGDDDDLPSLFPGMVEMTFGVIEEALERVAQGDPGEPQDESLAGECPVFEPEWRFIDWSQPARHIHNQVRSWFGNREQPKGAIGTVNGKSMVILKTRLLTHQIENGNSPGQIVSNDGNGLIIQCGDAPLKVLEWEPS